MTNKVYDILAWINRVFMPAAIVLVTAILGFCKTDAAIVATVSGIMAAVNAFLGAILQGSKTKFLESTADTEE